MKKKFKKGFFFIISLIILFLLYFVVRKYMLIDDSYMDILALEKGYGSNNTISLILKYIVLFFSFYLLIMFIVNIFLKVYIPGTPFRGVELDFYIPIFKMLIALNPFIWSNDFEFSMNIIFYIPMYTALIILLPKIKDCYIYVIIFVTPFLVEGFQYIFGVGATDMSDISCNLFGSLLGIILFKTIKSLKNIITKNI